MDFDMNRTWSQAMGLVGANFQLLAVIAGVFLLLPAVLLYVAMPDFAGLMTLGEDPEQMAEAVQSMLGPLAIYTLVAMVAQLIGYGAMVALMGDDRPTVGEAIGSGAKALLPLIGAFIVFVIGYIILFVAMSLLMGVIFAALGMGEGGGGIAVALGFVVAIAALLFSLYLAGRFSLTLPVVVLERRRNPISALARSWRLTAPYGRRIFLFFLLLIIAYFVLAIVIGGVLGVMAAAVATGTGSMLLMGLINGLLGALVAMVMSGIFVSMHQQLAGHGGAAVRETFE